SQGESRMPQVVQQFAGRGVPYLQGPVEADRSEAATVRTERQCRDGVAAMFGKRGQRRSPFLHVPELQGAAPGPEREARVRTESDARREFFVPGKQGKLVHELAVAPVPDLDCPVTRRRDVPAVVAERDRARRPELVMNVDSFREDVLTARQVPDLQPPVQ